MQCPRRADPADRCVRERCEIIKHNAPISPSGAYRAVAGLNEDLAHADRSLLRLTARAADRSSFSTIDWVIARFDSPPAFKKLTTAHPLALLNSVSPCGTVGRLNN